MFRALAIAVVLFLATTPVRAVDLVCVYDEKQMIEAAGKAGEQLIWMGSSNYQQPFWFFAGWKKETYTVWFQLPDSRICTGGGYFGRILQIGGNPA